MQLLLTDIVVPRGAVVGDRERAAHKLRTSAPGGWVRVRASTALFLTRPGLIALVASGWELFASTPASARRSANQPQPYVASKTTENGSGAS